MIRITSLILLSLIVTSPLRSQLALIDSIIHKDSLRLLVEYLASDSLRGRATGSVEANQVATFIANEFSKSGIKPVAGNRGYFVEGSYKDLNVIGALPGNSKPNELIIFCAHYDHIGTLPILSKNNRSEKKILYIMAQMTTLQALALS